MPAAGTPPANVVAAGNQFFNVNFRKNAYGSENRTFDMTLNADLSIDGVATLDVPTTVMNLFGYDNVDVEVECTAKLNYTNTDIMMVLDTTGSMDQVNPSDTVTRMTALKSVVTNFHNQLETGKGPGTRIRYGFVPYSTNVNVGHLLQDNWVVSNWTYQSRRERPRRIDRRLQASTSDNWTYGHSGTYTAVTTHIHLCCDLPRRQRPRLTSAWYSCDTEPPTKHTPKPIRRSVTPVD